MVTDEIFNPSSFAIVGRFFYLKSKVKLENMKRCSGLQKFHIYRSFSFRDLLERDSKLSGLE